MFEEDYNVIQEGSVVNGLSSYITKVFVWMFVGLLVTAGVAYGLAATGLFVFFYNPIVLIGLIIAEFALVIYLSRVSHDIAPTRAKIAFVAYSIINGITLASIFLVYSIGLIYQAFFTSALMFGIMAVYGHVTKSDLSRIGSICIMGLIGVILATLINYLLGIFGLFSTSFDLILSYITIFLFLGLTAWDMQKIKANYYATQGDSALSERVAIVSALALYLDFINLFLYVLKIFARSRD